MTDTSFIILCKLIFTFFLLLLANVSDSNSYLSVMQIAQSARRYLPSACRLLDRNCHNSLVKATCHIENIFVVSWIWLSAAY